MGDFTDSSAPRPLSGETFQRVHYAPWHQISSPDTATAPFATPIPSGPSRIGLQIHVLPDIWLTAPSSYTSDKAVTLHAFDPATAQALTISATNTDCTQTLQFFAAGSPAGPCARYTATSKCPDNAVRTHMAKIYHPPLELSGHKAIGFRLRGDGKGSVLMLQLTDGATASNHYVSNDYTGWHFHQLPRPAKDNIDDATSARWASPTTPCPRTLRSLVPSASSAP